MHFFFFGPDPHPTPTVCPSITRFCLPFSNIVIKQICITSSHRKSDSISVRPAHFEHLLHSSSSPCHLNLFSEIPTESNVTRDPSRWSQFQHQCAVDQIRCVQIQCSRVRATSPECLQAAPSRLKMFRQATSIRPAKSLILRCSLKLSTMFNIKCM